MGMIYTQKARQAAVFADDSVDAEIVATLEKAVAAAEVASGTVAASVVSMVYRHHDAFIVCLPDDKANVVGGLKAWRKEVWSTMFGDFADQKGISKSTRKAIAPYVSTLGTALWYGVRLVKGERLKTISEIREEVAELQDPKSGADIVIGAINALCPVRNGKAKPRYDQEHVALACASITVEQANIIGELAILINGARCMESLIRETREEGGE